MDYRLYIRTHVYPFLQINLNTTTKHFALDNLDYIYLQYHTYKRQFTKLTRRTVIR